MVFYNQMKSLDAPEVLTFYVLIQQSSTSLHFSTTGAPVTSGTASFGTGFYSTRDDAEKARTYAYLNEKSGAQYHIFELDFPNPAYQKTG